MADRAWHLIAYGNAGLAASLRGCVDDIPATYICSRLEICMPSGSTSHDGHMTSLDLEHMYLFFPTQSAINPISEFWEQR